MKFNEATEYLEEKKDWNKIANDYVNSISKDGVKFTDKAMLGKTIAKFLDISGSPKEWNSIASNIFKALSKNGNIKQIKKAKFFTVIK